MADQDIEVKLPIIDASDITDKVPIGSGGFGSVFKCEHANWGTVALKQLNGIRLEDYLKQRNNEDPNNKDPNMKDPTDNFRKEAQKMFSVVSSPYLIHIMGLLTDQKGLGIVMEYMPNGSLNDFQQKYMGCDCWARKVKMVQDIALGMNYLHTLNPYIIHRDLKLENVFVGNGLEAKIGDLGLAVSSKSRRLTYVAGTTSHIPPEAARAATHGNKYEPDKFWDVYTFAITTYEITSGHEPWPQQSKFANDLLVAIWVAKGERPSLDTIPKDAPEELIELIKKCWVDTKTDRPDFKVIVKQVTALFESKFRDGLLQADMAIMAQMNESRQHDKLKENNAKSDSDFWSFSEKSFDDGGSDSAYQSCRQDFSEKILEANGSKNGKHMENNKQKLESDSESRELFEVITIKQKAEVEEELGALEKIVTKTDEIYSNHTMEGYIDSSDDVGHQDQMAEQIRKPQWSATVNFISDIYRIGQLVLKRMETLAPSELLHLLKEELTMALSALDDCRCFVSKKVIRFYDDEGKLNAIGQAAMNLQKNVDEVSRSLESSSPGSKRLSWFVSFVRRKFSDTKLDGFAQNLKAAACDFKNEVEKELPYVALLDYEATDQFELSFKEGELLKIKEKRGDVWLAKSIETGEEGLVLSDLIERMKGIKDELWYFGRMRAVEASRRLTMPGLQQGTFLIRDSTSNPGEYSLSIRDHEADKRVSVQHYQIHITYSGEFYIDSPKSAFSAMDELVKHYQESERGLCCKLTSPCPKQTASTDDMGDTVFSDELDIPRESLTCHKQIRMTEFAEVWQGNWINGASQIAVAIEILRSDSTESSTYLKQAKLMAKLEHKNVVALYGICPKEESFVGPDQPVYFVRELMVNGSLLDYLKEGEGQHMEMKEMIDIAAQIAAGMAYLEKQCIIHRLLMAKSIVIGEHNAVKVTDLHLAVQADADCVYQVESDAQIALPVRRIAPEILDGRFSNKSDVWAFGILLAEIVAHGQQPYHDLKNKEVLEKIEHGFCIPKPEDCPERLYKIMKSTWYKDAKIRPRFAVLQLQLETYYEQYLKLLR